MSAFYKRFFRKFYDVGARIVCRVGYHFNRAVRQRYSVNNRRSGRYQVKIIFTFETFLNNLHVKQTEKAAAEAETECRRTFRLKFKRSIIEFEFFERVAQVAVF